MKTEILHVAGMTCGSCTRAVVKALKAVPGVGEASVDLQRGEATVRFDEAAASVEALGAAIRQAGFDVSGRPSSANPGGCCCADR